MAAATIVPTSADIQDPCMVMKVRSGFRFPALHVQLLQVVEVVEFPRPQRDPSVDMLKALLGTLFGALMLPCLRTVP